MADQCGYYVCVVNMKRESAAGWFGLAHLAHLRSLITRLQLIYLCVSVLTTFLQFYVELSATHFPVIESLVAWQLC